MVQPLASWLIQPLFWKQYIYDVISAVSLNEVECPLSHFNLVEASIEFTFKREKRCLPFLDLNVHMIN